MNPVSDDQQLDDIKTAGQTWMRLVQDRDLCCKEDISPITNSKWLWIDIIIVMNEYILVIHHTVTLKKKLWMVTNSRQSKNEHEILCVAFVPVSLWLSILFYYLCVPLVRETVKHPFGMFLLYTNWCLVYCNTLSHQ